MATSRAQRAGIWVIAIVLTVGTVAGFIAMILAPQNQETDRQKMEAAYTKYQKDYETYQNKADAQQKELDKRQAELSKKYYSALKAYKDKYLGKFSAQDAQKKLVIKDLKQGSGQAIGNNTTYAAFYIGWKPDGKVFDGSIAGSKLKTPLIVRPGGVISGWSEGVKQMKIGGIRLVTIPSEKAYGSEKKENIPADTPLRFIVMPIEVLETLKEPEIPQELLQ